MMTSTIAEQETQKGVAEASTAAPAKKARRGAQKAEVAPPAKKATKKATASKPPRTARPTAETKPATKEGSKSAQIIALLQRAKGASLDELMTATGWQRHSVRGFLSGTIGKKMGLKLTSTKREDGARIYSLVN